MAHWQPPKALLLDELRKRLLRDTLHHGEKVDLRDGCRHGGYCRPRGGLDPIHCRAVVLRDAQAGEVQRPEQPLRGCVAGRGVPLGYDEHRTSAGAKIGIAGFKCDMRSVVRSERKALVRYAPSRPRGRWALALSANCNTGRFKQLILHVRSFASKAECRTMPHSALLDCTVPQARSRFASPGFARP